MARAIAERWKACAVLEGAWENAVHQVFLDTCRLSDLLAAQPPNWQAGGELRLTASSLTAWKSYEPGKPRTLRSTASTQLVARPAPAADRAAAQQGMVVASHSAGSGGASEGPGSGGGGGGGGAAALPVQAVARQHAAPAVSTAGSVVASAPAPGVAGASQQGSQASLPRQPVQAGAASAAATQPAVRPAQQPASRGIHSQSTLPASQLGARLPQTQQSQAPQQQRPAPSPQEPPRQASQQQTQQHAQASAHCAAAADPSGYLQVGSIRTHSMPSCCSQPQTSACWHAVHCTDNAVHAVYSSSCFVLLRYPKTLKTPAAEHEAPAGHREATEGPGGAGGR